MRFEQEYVLCVRNEEECVCSGPNCCDTEQRERSKMWRTDYRCLPRSHCADFHRNRSCPEALVNVLRKKGKFHAYRISVLLELKEPDQVKRVANSRWFQTHLKENPGILDYTWFSDEAWFTRTKHEPWTPWKQTSLKKFRQWQRTYWQGLSKI